MTSLNSLDDHHFPICFPYFPIENSLIGSDHFSSFFHIFPYFHHFLIGSESFYAARECKQRRPEDLAGRRCGRHVGLRRPGEKLPMRPRCGRTGDGADGPRFSTPIPSGKHTKNYQKSPCLMGRSTITGHFQ